MLGQPAGHGAMHYEDLVVVTQPVLQLSGGAPGPVQGQQFGGVGVEFGCAAAEKPLATDGCLLAQAGQLVGGIEIHVWRAPCV